MNLLELIKTRRSIRKYDGRQIPEEALKQIIEAGLYAPNAGGRQSPYIVALHDRGLAVKIGRLNWTTFDRGRLAGNYVSKEQPSIIDDASIHNAFYDAPCVCAIFAQANFLYGEADCWCCATNMVLMAHSLGISSGCIARGKETFARDPEWLKLMDVPDGYEGCCFVALGYCQGKYPEIKPRRPGRCKIME